LAEGFVGERTAPLPFADAPLLVGTTSVGASAASGVTTSVPLDDASIVPPTRLLGLTGFKCRQRDSPKLGRVHI
jgi:hypothetical protein